MSSERDERYPLIIAGGACAFNAEPVADFIDAFVLGDGEEIINEIIDVHQAWKGKSQSKKELLHLLSKIEGIYIPSFYNIEYNQDGTAAGIAPLNNAPEKINRRITNASEATQSHDYDWRWTICFATCIRGRRQKK